MTDGGPSRAEAGFTLVELMIALVLIGILLVLAVPSFLDMRKRAEDHAAKANIRAAVPAIEAFAIDNVGAPGDADGKKGTSGFKGATLKILRKYDSGLAPTLVVVSGKTSTTAYCLADKHGKKAWSALGPGIGDDSFVPNAKCK